MGNMRNAISYLHQNFYLVLELLMRRVSENTRSARVLREKVTENQVAKSRNKVVLLKQNSEVIFNLIRTAA
jgi:hypothetical protein